jgi:hypothetical protein
MQEALLPTDSSKAAFPMATALTSDPVLPPHTLWSLGERLRVSYDMHKEPLPVRLTELVERLARREQAKE